MASSATSGARVEKMDAGDKSGTWGATQNNNADIWDRWNSQMGTIAITSGTTTISATDYTLGDWHYNVWNLSGTLTGNTDLVVPNYAKSWWIYNGTSGSFTLTIKVSGQTGVVLPQGEWTHVYNTGTDVARVTYSPDLLNLNNATAETSVAGGDSVLIWDTSASAVRKATVTNLAAATQGLSCHLNGHSWSVATGTTTQITNSDVTVVADTSTLWNTGSDYISIPSGYTGAKIFFNVLAASGTSYNVRAEIQKNGTSSNGTSQAPMIWTNSNDGGAGIGDNAATLAIYDAVSASDVYRFYARHDRSGSQNLVFEIYVELIV